MSHAEYDTIPELTMGALNRYVDHRIATGDFLRAVLAGDLFSALGRADLSNRRNIYEICSYIVNETPSGCWGSYDIVARWLAGE